MMTTNKAREQANFYATILERTGVSLLGNWCSSATASRFMR
jgi:hypothetical protein